MAGVVAEVGGIGIGSARAVKGPVGMVCNAAGAEEWWNSRYDRKGCRRRARGAARRLVKRLEFEKQ